MKAIILSAGQGSRLLPLTADRPKCSLPIAGQPLLAWQLQQAALAGIDEAVVVTGFHCEQVEQIVAATPAPRVRTLFNPFYAVSDNLGTCWIARAEMAQPFVLINGDTLFEAAILARLLDADPALPITLVSDRKSAYDEDDMKIIAEGRQLRRVSKRLDHANVNGESIGMIRFQSEGAARFREKIEAMMQSGEGLKRWYLSAIDELAQAGGVAICPIEGLSWCEVDDRDDLVQAEAVVSLWPRALSRTTQSNTLSG